MDDSLRHGPSVSHRPKPVRRDAPKLPDSEPSRFVFRLYEAAVGELTCPANGRRSMIPVSSHLSGGCTLGPAGRATHATWSLGPLL